MFVLCLQAARGPTTGSKCVTHRKQHNVVECYNIRVSVIVELIIWNSEYV